MKWWRVAAVAFAVAIGIVPSSIAPSAAATGDSTFVTITPARIADTRSGQGGVKGPLASDTTTDFTVIDVGGVPAGATAVALNVTVVNPAGGGYVTVFPKGQPKPESSSVNFAAGATVPNLVIARVGDGGRISVYNFGGFADVLLDVTGYFVAGTAAGCFYTFTPFRNFDTRVNKRTDGMIYPIGPRTVMNMGFFPKVGSHLVAVLLNVTATNTTAAGYLTLAPTGDIFPATSNLNFKAGQTVANAVIVKLGVYPNYSNNSVSIYNFAGFTDVIVDVLGVFDDGTNPTDFTGTPLVFRPLDQPQRVYDSRPTAPLNVAETRFVKVTEAGGAAPGARLAVLNVTVTRTTAPSFLSVWPSTVPQPTVSSLNWAPGDTVANFVGVAVPSVGPAQGTLSVYNDTGSADVIIDATGYFYPMV